ncbi:MAG: 50S ribosomal protein L23 [Candidatus Omnitrophica bacterium 4484_70.2]|nr:MAG: 50S ribosomal protein L23 [Candidatus Omnitrophica bacterium 4484_70.2]
MDKITRIYEVIKSPLLTEKAGKLAKYNQYVFWVDKNANKPEIKKAVEEIYKVKVEKIRTLNMKGKTKRIRWGQEGKTSSWKKAVVTLKEGYQIKTV